MIRLCSDIINKKDINDLIVWLQDLPQLTKGEQTVEFEKQFSSYLGCEHSVFCNSGSSANLLITSTLIQSGRLKNPAALILVHVLGLDSSIEKVKEICDHHNVVVIEDTCESLGSTVSGKHLGTFGLASSFSFYFGHHISTIEGGMVCTNDKDFADVVKMIRSHGWDRDLDAETAQSYRDRYNITEFDSLYRFYYQGFNLRSTDLQAFIGLNQIPKINKIADIRERIYLDYVDSIKEDLWKPHSSQDRVSNMGYPVIVSNREEVSQELTKNNIECRPLLSGSMGLQPAWRDVYGECVLPNATIVNDYGMYVPNHQSLSHNDVETICEIINTVGKPYV